MTSQEFASRLALLDPEDDLAFDALTSQYLRDFADGTGSLMRLAQLPGGYLTPRAFSVLTQLEEAAVRPILAAIPKDDPPPAWMLFETVRGLLAAETAVIERLREALGNDGVVRPPFSPRAEERTPPSRVRDQAYLALRRILHAESSLQYDMESRNFLEGSDSWKDREIENYLAEGTFTQFLQDVGDEDIE